MSSLTDTPVITMTKPKRPSRGKPHAGKSLPDRSQPVGLRIVGGTFRGRKLQYGGDPRVRPMKDRVREAVFNLVGPSVRGKQVLDLFAGTGALALEAISRGAVGATLVECHYPTAKILRENLATLGVEGVCRVEVADTFHWLTQQPELPEANWLVFISPPYDFYVSRTDDMVRLIETLHATAPPESVLVVESDQRFDFTALGQVCEWNVRDYPPARIGISRQ